MLGIQIIIGILVVHFIADFYYQTSKMATQKSTSVKWLTYHILTYTFVLFLGGFLYWNGQHIAVIYFALINGAAHWIVDFFTSKITRYLWKARQVHNFFVVIGLDQLIHYITLFTTYTLLFK